MFNRRDKNNEEMLNSKKSKQIGLEVKLPGCSEFVPLGKAQYNRIYLDDIGPRLLIIADECAELLEPSGIKTEEGKEEDAMKGEIVGLMKSITQLGRSSGIHMVLATQRNDAALSEDLQLTIIRDNKPIDILWKDLQIGDKFENGSICTNIGEWFYEDCYEITDEKGNSLQTSSSHTMYLKVLDKNGNIYNHLLQESILSRERLQEKDELYIVVKEAKEYLDKGYIIINPITGNKILSITSLFNGEMKKVRCIQTNDGYYDIRQFRSHNSIIP